MPRPRLTAVGLSTAEYIAHWGTELYDDYCAALGITPLGYWKWRERTQKHGVDWWHRDLKLEQIRAFPPANEYRMCVRAAHPDEADGPKRLAHYVAKRAVGMSAEQVHTMLWHELGGIYDTSWYTSTCLAIGSPVGPCKQA